MKYENLSLLERFAVVIGVVVLCIALYWLFSAIRMHYKQVQETKRLDKEYQDVVNDINKNT